MLKRRATSGDLAFERMQVTRPRRGLTTVYGLIPLGQGDRRWRASLTHGRGDGLQSYIRPLVWSLAAPGQHGIRAPGANRCSGLEGTRLITALLGGEGRLHETASQLPDAL